MPRRPTRSDNPKRPTRTNLARRIDDLGENGDEPTDSFAAWLFPDPDSRPVSDVAALRKFMRKADAAGSAPGDSPDTGRGGS